MKKLLIGMFVISMASSVVCHAQPETEQEAMIDESYQVNIDKTKDMLQSRGYRAIEIKSDEYRGNQILQVQAIKNGQTYHIRLAYPSLKILSEKREK